MNIERELCKLVAKAANLPPTEIDPKDNIFEEGWIDSLGLYRLLLEAERELGIKLPEGALLDNRVSTVAGLADLFQQEKE